MLKQMQRRVKEFLREFCEELQRSENTRCKHWSRAGRPGALLSQTSSGYVPDLAETHADENDSTCPRLHSLSPMAPLGGACD